MNLVDHSIRAAELRVSNIASFAPLEFHWGTAALMALHV
jgi:hypothetical protein